MNEVKMKHLLPPLQECACVCMCLSSDCVIFHSRVLLHLFGVPGEDGEPGRLWRAGGEQRPREGGPTRAALAYNALLWPGDIRPQSAVSQQQETESAPEREGDRREKDFIVPVHLPFVSCLFHITTCATSSTSLSPNLSPKKYISCITQS